MIVRTLQGRTYTLNTNWEVAKFHLFIVPKLAMAGDRAVGDLPELKMDDDVLTLSTIKNTLRLKKAKALPSGDDLPF